MDNKIIARYMIAGAAVGLIFGVVFGIIGIGLALGTGVGVAFGAVAAKRATAIQREMNPVVTVADAA